MAPTGGSRDTSRREALIFSVHILTETVTKLLARYLPHIYMQANTHTHTLHTCFDARTQTEGQMFLVIVKGTRSL